jgi:hypothetical protein
MDALGISLIVIGLALVCGGLIFQRRFLEPDEESSQEGRSGEIPKVLIQSSAVCSKMIQRMRKRSAA